MSHVPSGLLGKRTNGTVSENITILILSWVLAGWEGTEGLISRVFNLSLSLGTSDFGADAGGPMAPARSQDFCIQAPSAPLWNVCPDVKALRGTVGMFNQDLGPRLGIYRLGP